MNAINKNGTTWCMRCYKHFESNYARLCDNCLDELTINKLMKSEKPGKSRKCAECGETITHGLAFPQCHKCRLIKLITTI